MESVIHTSGRNPVYCGSSSGSGSLCGSRSPVRCVGSPPRPRQRLESRWSSSSPSGPSTSAPRARRRLQPCRAWGPSFSAFEERDYYPVSVQMAQFDQSGQTGFLLLLRSDTALEASSRGLVLSVSGDVLLGVASQLARRPPERPLTLDTAWALSDWALARGGARLARAAIVDIRGQTYVGRLCFADAASGEAAWDCDCRPSDACWLASEAGCPLYVLRSIWEQQSIQLESMAQRQGGAHAWEGGRDGGGLRMDRPGVERGAPRAPDPHLMERREPPRHLPGRKALSDPAPAPNFAFYRAVAPGSALALVANIRPGDPDPVRRLKMELRVALKEEDYVKAAEIRDHPFMQLQASIALAEDAGNGAQARSLRAQLLSSIAETERIARTAEVQRTT